VARYFFSYTSKDDEYNDYELDEEEKGPALEIYGTDLTLLARQSQLEECFVKQNY
jgi:hypothetical protein